MHRQYASTHTYIHPYVCIEHTIYLFKYVMYEDLLNICRYAHAMECTVAGDIVLLLLGVPEDNLPHLNHITIRGTPLDLDKVMKILSVNHHTTLMSTPELYITSKIDMLCDNYKITFDTTTPVLINSKDILTLNQFGINIDKTFIMMNKLDPSHFLTIKEHIDNRVILPVKNSGHQTIINEENEWEFVKLCLPYIKAGWKIHPKLNWNLYYENTIECSICQNEDTTNTRRKYSIKTMCGHSFHFDCLKRWCETNESCPMCRSDEVIEFSH